MYNTQAAQGATQNGQPFGNFGRGCDGFRGPKSGRQMPPWMQKFAGGPGSRVPVNISESDEAYTMWVYAAGLVKEQISIAAKDDVLTIAYKANDGNGEGKYSHQEFVPGSFERAFQLNTKVLTSSISASYTDGVLKVTLPKNPETTRPAQTVSVA